MKKIKNESISFEEYDIKFTKKEFENIDIDTLIELKRKVRNTIKEIQAKLS